MGLLCLAVENAPDVPSRAIVFNPAPFIDGPVRVALAAAGFTSVRIVRTLDDSVTTSVVTHPPVALDKRVREVLSVSFDADVLRALAPDVRIRVGSLLNMFPSTMWRSDGGAQALIFGAATDPPPRPRAPSFSASARAASLYSGARHASGPVRHALDEVPDTYTRGVIRYSARVHSVAGVPLAAGDTVEDAAGAVWYYANGVLADRQTATVRAADMRALDSGAALAPRHANAPPPSNYQPGALYALTIVWPREGAGESTSTVFPATAFSSGGVLGYRWGWTLDKAYATVEHPRGICQGEHGVAMDVPTPQACVAAGGTWDRPCAVDTECPYYDARRGRGGCNGGFCEMPLGVDRRSFRAPQRDAREMRTGCTPDDPSYPWCSDSPHRDVRFTRQAGESWRGARSSAATARVQEAARQ